MDTESRTSRRAARLAWVLCAVGLGLAVTMAIEVDTP
jgi:hypothetical protein